MAASWNLSDHRNLSPEFGWSLAPVCHGSFIFVNNRRQWTLKCWEPTTIREQRRSRHAFHKECGDLAEAIRKAIDDHVITTAERDQIMQLAHQVGVIDNHEHVLLGEFIVMITDGTIRRMPQPAKVLPSILDSQCPRKEGLRHFGCPVVSYDPGVGRHRILPLFST